jgi:hypothetical protein
MRDILYICECDSADILPRDLLLSLEGDERTRTITHNVAACGALVLCELCALDDIERTASTIHVDYVVCADHETVAINNVAGR